MARPWLRLRRFVMHNILHADDTPHSIALGTAIAVFIAILPLVGVQMFLAVAVAALFRVNRAVCIPVVWITNPITIVPLYGACLAMGRLVLGTKADATPILDELTTKSQSASWLDLEFWTHLLSLMVNVGGELWIGCSIVGAAVAIISYPVMRWLVISYRERRRQRLLHRELLRANAAAGGAPGNGDEA